jgi:hypothetical protein
MWGVAALVRTDVSEEGIAFVIMVKRIGELGTTLAVRSNRSTRRPALGRKRRPLLATNPSSFMTIQGLILLTMSRISLMGDAGTSAILALYEQRDYDLFAKMKEPLRGTRYNTREEIIGAVGRSLLDINRVDTLMVYDAFHNFDRRWFTWGGDYT